MPEDVKEQAASSAATEEESEVKGTPKPDDEETVDNVPWNKDPRFKDFIGKRKLLKEYEGLGSPGEIQGYVQQLEERLGKLEADREPKEPKTAEQKGYEAKLKEARQQLREIDPDIGKVESLARAIEASNRSLEVRALDETTQVMKAAGLSVTQGDVRGMTNILADIIGNDEVLLAEYMGNPREAVRLAFKRLADIGKSAGVDRSDKAAVQREKEKQTKLPKPQAAGGSGSSKAPERGGGIRGAYERSKQLLKGLD